QHARRHVGSQNAAPGADALSRHHCRIPRAGPQVEYPAALGHPGEVEHRLRCRPERLQSCRPPHGATRPPLLGVPTCRLEPHEPVPSSSSPSPDSTELRSTPIESQLVPPCPQREPLNTAT